MSKVLVIEPYKMLQHALAIALLPDFQLQFASALTADNNTSKFEIVVVDVAALTESAGAAAATVQAVLAWQLPTVLIERALTPPIAEREGLIRINTPVSRDSLRLALVQCLAGASLGANAAKKVKAIKIDKPPKPTSATALTVEEKLEPIELVDVIEEPRVNTLDKN